ncbi:hypothetical protein GCM10010300_80350 [Streptomyces olivaceoviridis]|nr:hypothetical protein GCM10010300_80350 [Streptomyces olivaceoviridis]
MTPPEPSLMLLVTPARWASSTAGAGLAEEGKRGAPQPRSAGTLGALPPAPRRRSGSVHGDDGAVRAVVGLAWTDERDLSPEELTVIGEDASTLPATAMPA